MSVDLRIVAVHGTNDNDLASRGERWWQTDSPFYTEFMARFGDDADKIEWLPWHWDGKNAQDSRIAAGKRLKSDLLKLQRDKPKKTVLIGHSHGGNVAEYAFKDLKDKTDYRIVTVGTPFFGPDHELDEHDLTWPGLRTYALGGVLLLALILCSIFVDDRVLQLLLGASFLAVILPSIGSFLKSAFLALRDMAMGTQLKERAIKNAHDDKRLRLFSQLDEAINGLHALPNQDLQVASRETVQKTLWLVSSLATFITLTLTVGRNTFQDFYKLITPHSEAPASIPPGQVTEPPLIEWEALSNLRGSVNPPLDSFIPADAAVFLGYLLLVAIAFTIGGMIAFALSNRLAWLINEIFLENLIAQAYGRKGSDHLMQTVEANEPPRTRDMDWHALPDSFDKIMERMTEKTAVQTVTTARKMLSSAMVSGYSNIIDAIAGSLTYDELIHTSYFDVPQFQKFIALWIYIEYHPEAAEFVEQDENDIFAWIDWYKAIKPKYMHDAEQGSDVL